MGMRKKYIVEYSYKSVIIMFSKIIFCFYYFQAAKAFSEMSNMNGVGFYEDHSRRVKHGRTVCVLNLFFSKKEKKSALSGS